MYEEFIIGYIISGVAVVLLAVVIILQCIILKRMASGKMRSNDSSYASYSRTNNYGGGSRGTAICRNCATQFDAAHAVCPRCGTPR